MLLYLGIQESDHLQTNCSTSALLSTLLSLRIYDIEPSPNQGCRDSTGEMRTV